MVEEVKIEKPSEDLLKELAVESWPVWEKEVSDFDWEYDDWETFYVIEGKVKVDTPQGTVAFGKGDIVTFPKGMKCTWHVLEPIRKHYNFGLKR